MYMGRYEVIRKIGSGGFGEVLLARALGAEGFERIVALKRLKGDLARRAGSLKGIINEARIGGLLNHPNIVQVLEFIHLEPDFLLVMEYVDGIAVQELLDMEREAGNLLTAGLALDIGIQTCEGLHYAHTARSVTGKPLKLVHRDIKPSNIMITRTGTVKIMDFGVARSSSNMGQSSTGSIKGTLRYLSPEQAEGSKETGHQSDIFSLGLVLCEMIVGHPVYEADQEHLVLLKALQADTTAAVNEAEARVPGMGPILARCLAPDPSERFRTADTLGQALRRLKKGFPIGTGLADLVEKALALRKSASDESALSEEDSFSLELRLKGMDRPLSARTLGLLDREPGQPVDGEENGSRAASRSAADPVPDEPWEWEWRVTTYPSARSELEDEKDADFDHLAAHHPDPGTVSTGGGEGSQPATARSGSTPSGLISLPSYPRGAAAPSTSGSPDRGELPFDTHPRGAVGGWQRLLEHRFVHAMLGFVLALILVAIGFLAGVKYASGAASSAHQPVEPVSGSRD